MAYEALDLIAGFVYSAFGSPLIMGTVVSFFLIAILLSLRADASVILAALIPMIAGFVLNTVDTNFLSIEGWVLLTLFIMAGLMFSLFFLFFFK